MIAQVITEPHIVLEKGSTGLLPCKYERKVSAVTWTKGPSSSEAELLLIYDTFKSKWRKWGPGYEDGYYNITSNYSLVINSARIENNDRYYCEVSDLESGFPIMNRTDVIVFGKYEWVSLSWLPFSSIPHPQHWREKHYRSMLVHSVK